MKSSTKQKKIKRKKTNRKPIKKDLTEAEKITKKARNLCGTFRWGKGGTAMGRKLIENSLGKKCYWCGRIITLDNFAADHKIPLNRPMDHSEEELKKLNSLKNIRVICQRCNHYLKGSLPEPQLKKLLKFLKKDPILEYRVLQALYYYNSRYDYFPHFNI